MVIIRFPATLNYILVLQKPSRSLKYQFKAMSIKVFPWLFTFPKYYNHFQVTWATAYKTGWLIKTKSRKCHHCLLALRDSLRIHALVVRKFIRTLSSVLAHSFHNETREKHSQGLHSRYWTKLVFLRQSQFQVTVASSESPDLRCWPVSCTMT